MLCLFPYYMIKTFFVKRVRRDRNKLQYDKYVLYINRSLSYLCNDILNDNGYTSYAPTSVQ